MAGKLNRLTVRQVQTITAPGRYADGGGLYLKVRPSGSRQWVFLFARIEAGKRVQTEIGLGSAAPGGVSLAMAREKAEEHRRSRSVGNDPLKQKRADKAAARVAGMTFGRFADDYVKAHESEWSNAKHAAQWSMTLGPSYCKPIRSKPIAVIGVDDVLEVLSPVWQTKPETARRVRMRIEKVLDAARVKGLRSGENPARWKGHLDHLLPKHGKLTKSHHAAMPWKEVPDFLRQLERREGTAALALRFLILTASRTSEVLKARWDEIDCDRAIWKVRAERMKARREHRVPLSGAALAILEKTKGKHKEFVFPGPSDRGPLSGMALLMLLRRLKRDDVTAHGFRSAFRDWAAECTNFPREAAEKALAHRVENATEAAYRRGDLFEKRVKLMEAWAEYCETRGTNVISLRPAI
jgi:integrase